LIDLDFTIFGIRNYQILDILEANLRKCLVQPAAVCEKTAVDKPNQKQYADCKQRQ
jgi:hypothetical protein